ncbi:YhgE/Pip domain-containing protein [Fonticella tunisiensis]|uniref:Putative membrane protein n=1 Tax=Fonticella tunisiensis TaxID=1096341 RepID=A0A4R7KRR5_9CLOT|nr:YhgE/Pip domain-containing protein [Fonticella tunisiensis]TDT61313.1 putative membrane protein [Fonticella tunisiensis]
MTLLQIPKDELKTLWNNKIKIVAIVAIIAIPLLYSFLYLKAYWDPYGNLKDYHIAVVNMDKGAVMEDKTENFGKDIIDKLKERQDIGFEFVDSKTAQAGLENGKYFAVIEIPEDFSKRIVSAKDGNVVYPSINYYSNNKKNYIGTKISDSIKDQILKEVRESISKQYGEIAFSTINDLKDGLKDASSGSDKLLEGSNTLHNGIETLSKGLKDFESQVPGLQSGTSSLSEGADSLNKGLNEFNLKLPALSDAIDQLHSGADSLNEGLSSTNEGATHLVEKAKSLKDGGSALINNYENNLLPGYLQLSQGLKYEADNLNAGALQVQAGVNSLISSVVQTQAALDEAQKYLQLYLKSPGGAQAMADPNMQAFLSVMQNISNSNSDDKIKDLQNELDDLIKGTSNLSNQLDMNRADSAVSTYYAGLKDLKVKGILPYTFGVNQYVDGVNKLASGIGTLSQGASRLASGLDSLNENMFSLLDASNSLYTGSSILSKGIHELTSKMPSLASGVGQLSQGSQDLTRGISTLRDGIKELNYGLKDGVKNVENNIKSSSKDLGEFIGNPVKVSETNVNPVDNYGSGLAPYFLPISLWLGAVFMLLIIKIKNENYKTLNNLQLTIGKYILYALIGIIQAVLLGGIVLLLGIKPSNLPLLFAFLMLMALSFDSIIYCFISLFGLAGEGIAVILLVLQLCSDAGTFPIETLPQFFQNISPYLPFTYAVEAIREILFASTLNASIIVKDSVITMLFGLVFMVINIIFIRKGEAINKSIEDRLAA